MLKQIIDRIEQRDTIENVAIDYHKPSNAVYITVNKDFNYKIISKERFSFNSKYSMMDFYSNIISTNKSVDTKKQISSNNYLTFFCKNNGKLNNEIIDKYYERLNTPEEHLIYRDWIKENIFEIFKEMEKNKLVKIFFVNNPIEKFITLGKEYLQNNILSNKLTIDDNVYGNSAFINLNAHKPFLKNKTRKVQVPIPIDIEEAIKIKYLQDIFIGFYKRGYEVTYIMEDGRLYPINLGAGEGINRSFTNGIIIAYKLDNRGNLIILDMDVIPSYSPYL